MYQDDASALSKKQVNPPRWQCVESADSYDAALTQAGEVPSARAGHAQTLVKHNDSDYLIVFGGSQRDVFGTRKLADIDDEDVKRQWHFGCVCFAYGNCCATLGHH